MNEIKLNIPAGFYELNKITDLSGKIIMTTAPVEFYIQAKQGQKAKYVITGHVSPVAPTPKKKGIQKGFGTYYKMQDVCNALNKILAEILEENIPKEDYESYNQLLIELAPKYQQRVRSSPTITKNPKSRGPTNILTSNNGEIELTVRRHKNNRTYAVNIIDKMVELTDSGIKIIKERGRCKISDYHDYPTAITLQQTFLEEFHTKGYVTVQTSHRRNIPYHSNIVHNYQQKQNHQNSTDKLDKEEVREQNTKPNLRLVQIPPIPVYAEHYETVNNEVKKAMQNLKLTLNSIGVTIPEI